MVRGSRVNNRTNVIDTRSMPKSRRKRFGRCFFFGWKSSEKSTASTLSDRATQKVRFVTEPTIQSLERKSAKERADMFYTRPELQQISIEIIEMIIMDQQGMKVRGSFRGLENMKKVGITDNPITESRKKYVRKIVAEHRALRRNQKSEEFIRDRIYEISCKETCPDRNDGVKLGKLDAKAAGIQNHRLSQSCTSNSSIEAVHRKPDSASCRTVSRSSRIPYCVPPSNTPTSRAKSTSSIPTGELNTVAFDDSDEQFEC
mmetsp:Transcript_31623/g.35963  ORF Transcript_31623/g.35963 Transcript_31623/m.35963 type:complete len:259 (-) Transcript_31623:385-1161(-)